MRSSFPLDRVGRIIQELRPQRDSNWPTGTRENFWRGAALRYFVSDIGRFGCSVPRCCEPRRAVVFPAVVASGWQRAW